MMHPGAAAALIAIFAAIAVPKSSGHGWVDGLAFAFFLIFLWWLISDFSVGRIVDAKGHESAPKGIAFLAGKKLNRIWRRLRGNTTASH